MISNRLFIIISDFESYPSITLIKRKFLKKRTLSFKPAIVNYATSKIKGILKNKASCADIPTDIPNESRST